MRTRLKARFAIPLLAAAAIAVGCGSTSTRPAVVGRSSDSQTASMVATQELAPAYVAQVAETPVSTPNLTVYTVPPNGNLSAAAASAEVWSDGSRWRRLCDANPEITNPNVVFVGEQLRIPDETETVAPRPACELPVAPVVTAVKAAGTTAEAVTATKSVAGALPTHTSTTAATSTTTDGSWAYYKLRIGGCESNGSPSAPINYTAHNASGASGGYQFMPGTWAGRYDVANAEDAAPTQQDAAADDLYASSGLRPWESSRSCWG